MGEVLTPGERLTGDLVVGDFGVAVVFFGEEPALVVGELTLSGAGLVRLVGEAAFLPRN